MLRNQILIIATLYAFSCPAGPPGGRRPDHERLAGVIPRTLMTPEDLAAAARLEELMKPLEGPVEQFLVANAIPISRENVTKGARYLIALRLQEEAKRFNITDLPRNLKLGVHPIGPLLDGGFPGVGPLDTKGRDILDKEIGKLFPGIPTTELAKFAGGPSTQFVEQALNYWETQRMKKP